MVYKKIGDKIPSLSSLLLAGVLLAGGCPSDKKDAAVAEESKAGGKGEEAKKSESEEAKKAGQVCSGPYAKAIKEIISHSVIIAGLDHLTGEQTPMTLDEDELEGDSKKVKQNVERLFNSFTTDRVLKAYPGYLKSCFAGLAHSKFKRFASGNLTGTKHKYAYGTAINAIAKFWDNLHTVCGEMMKSLDKGTLKDERAKLVQEVNNLLSQVTSDDGTSTNFSENTKFYDAKKATMLTGDQLARFLTEQDKKESNQNAKIGVKNLLKEKATVLVKLRKPTPDSPPADYFLKRLHIRGEKIESWCVYADKLTVNTIPLVDPFPEYSLKNFNEEFNFAKLVSQDSSEKAESKSQDCSENSVLSVDSQEQLTFGQLLFALFRGDTSRDFIKLAAGPEDEGNCVSLTGNDEKFQALIKVAKQSPGEFAILLGKHINDVKALKDLFVIPDQQDIESKIKQNIEGLLNDPKTPANEGGAEDSIVDGSLSAQIVDNILVKLFGVAEVQSAIKRNEYVKKVCNLDLTKKFNVSFEHLLGVEIIKGLDANKLLYSTTDGSANRLIRVVDGIIHRMLGQAVVYISDGHYQPTAVTNKIINWLKQFHNKLAQKHTNAYITYKDLEKDDAGKETGFKIDIVCKAMENDCKALKSILELNVDAILALTGKEVDYSPFLPNNIPFEKKHNKVFDRIRLAYQAINASRTDANKTASADANKASGA